jgi:predicted ArsR family transcriptional regulator
LNKQQTGGRGAVQEWRVDPDVQIFSSTKYRIMQLLKKEEQSDLEGLSKKLAISQMAVYKHVRELEGRGLIEHEARRAGVGRPRLVFRPSAMSRGVYPKGYSKIASLLLEYVQDRLGKEGIQGALDKLYERSLGEYAHLVKGGSLYERARKLASARDADGYFAEVTESGDGEIELLEHNCPVSCLSSRYPEICNTERLMFERLLEAQVRSVDSNPGGEGACRFRISGK